MEIVRREERASYIVVAGLLLVLACCTVQVVAGLGVSPSSFTVPDAQRGCEYESIITVFNAADDDVDCELNATGPGSEWMTFYLAEDPETPINTIQIKGLYLFIWDYVPGEDSEKLLRYLQEDLALGWAGNAELQKYGDNRAIRIVKDRNSADITLDTYNRTASLIICDGRTVDLRVKEEDGELKIYKGQSERERILVNIKVADDAPNNVHNSTIYITSMSPKRSTASGGAVAHLVTRMAVAAAIQVTGVQILNGTVKSITTSNTEVGYPLKIKVVLQNDGNVVARPAISSCVINSGGTNNSTVIDTFVHAETGIRPYKTGTITVLRNTTGHEPGDYNVSVNVSLAGEFIATKVLPFTILPRGALTRKGNLSSLYIEGKPQVNRVIKVVAEFENTGMIDTKVTFTGEVYRDGEFIDIVDSNEMLVTVGETYKLVSYYKILTPGAYLINGSVLYEGKETEALDASFSVAGALNGDLSSLSVEGKLLVGRTIKVIAEFENTGAIDTTASFVGEVYRDDEFMDIVESREKLVTV
ncbi:MAG: hypothetical protein KAT65_03720, partial [Methanophagales archaeon]|nr:hypothetical protein [Methanophagales archaeon]